MNDYVMRLRLDNRGLINLLLLTVAQRTKSLTSGGRILVVGRELESHSHQENAF